jgi:hypothetical protein
MQKMLATGKKRKIQNWLKGSDLRIKILAKGP